MRSNQTMKILLADDHAVVRHGLKQILAEDFKRSVFGEARNAQEALDLVWKENKLTVRVQPEDGVTYTTQFIGTRRPIDWTSKPAISTASGP